MNIFGLGLPELVLITFLLLLFFGKDRLPGLFRSIGSSIRNLKESIDQPPTQEPSTPQTSTSSPSEHQGSDEKDPA